MEKEVIVTAKTVEKAVAEGASKLGKTAEQVQYEVLTEAKRGLFGIGGNDAKVRVYLSASEETQEPTAQPVDSASADDSAQAEEPRSENSAAEPAQAGELGKRALSFLETLLSHLQPDAKAVLVSETEDALELNLTGPHLGGLIGRRGEVLDSIQYLTSLTVNLGRDGYCRVSLDAEGYRAKREQTVRRMTERMAEKVLKYHRSFALDPMNAYERRLVHAACAEIPGVSSHSVGEGAERHVVLSPERPEE